MILPHGHIDLTKADAHCYTCQDVGKFADQVVVIDAETHRPHRVCPKCAENLVASGKAFRLADCR